MERAEAPGLKSGRNPGQVGGGNTVGREGERQQETKRDKERVRQKRKMRKTEKGLDKGHREKTGRGRECQSKGEERQGEGGGELTRSQWSW